MADSVADSIVKPFAEKYNVGTVFIVTGLVLVAAFAWLQILRPIKDAVGDVVDEVVNS